MFVNRETGESAWLLEDDGNTVIYTEDGADAPADTRTEVVLSSYEFNSTHREATREEIDAGHALTPEHPDATHHRETKRQRKERERAEQEQHRTDE